MSKTLTRQTDFSKGAISPLLKARFDATGYNQSVESMVNMFPLVQGPARRRKGLKYIAETKDSASATRLIPFRFDEDTTVIIEMGDHYFRFYTEEDGRIEVASVPVEVTTVYGPSEIFDVQFTQSGLDMFFAHPDHPPQVLTRGTTTSSWTMGDYDLVAPPTDPLGERPTATLTPAAVSGLGVTFTASAASFLANDVGRQLVNLNGNGIASIVGYSSTTVVTADILVPFDSTAAIGSNDWVIAYSPIVQLAISGTGTVGEVMTFTTSGATEAFRTTDLGKYILMHGGMSKIVQVVSASQVRAVTLTAYTSTTTSYAWTLESPTWSLTRGYPTAVAFYEQRLWFGGTDAQPNKAWASATGLFDTFAQGGAADSDALQIDVSTYEPGKIAWFSPSTDLIVGTTTGIASITSSSGPITPSTVKNVVRRQEPTKGQRPVSLGSSTIFRTIDNTNTMNMYYDYRINSYSRDDLTSVTRETNLSPIVDMGYFSYPEYVLYLIREDGTVSCISFDKDQGLNGNTEMTTSGNYESVCATQTTAWFIVNRTINSATKRYVERFETGTGQLVTDGYMDCHKVIDLGTPGTAVTGLSHLEGREVQVKVDGALQASQTVSGGAITLEEAGTDVVVGLPYTSTLITLPLVLATRSGALWGRNNRWVEPVLDVNTSVYPTVDGQDRPNRTDGEDLDSPVELFTGAITYAPVGEDHLTITCDQPYPLTILAIRGEAEGED